jgi:hypothetical protein
MKSFFVKYLMTDKAVGVSISKARQKNSLSQLQWSGVSSPDFQPRTTFEFILICSNLPNSQ